MQDKPIIGFSIGDVNGIGPEIIAHLFADSRLFDLCTPVIFGSGKVINFYRKLMPGVNIKMQSVETLENLNPKQLNAYSLGTEEIPIEPGVLSDSSGRYAVASLQAAVQALKDNLIDGLVTAPIHKKNIQSAEFNFTGHTPFLLKSFGMKDVVMMLCSDRLRVAVATEHVPIQEVAPLITKQLLLSKLNIMDLSLQRDFGIDRPKIAVLGLNPHAGDEGLIGKEEKNIIAPAIKEAKAQGKIVMGPYPADAFFANRHFEKFDAVLAMYHDQGLVPFKTLAFGEGINFTAGLPVVRTSPDHGVAFDIAGQNIANPSSILAALYLCIDVIKQRAFFDENRKNPLKKINAEAFARMEDEAI